MHIGDIADSPLIRYSWVNYAIVITLGRFVTPLSPESNKYHEPQFPIPTPIDLCLQ